MTPIRQMRVVERRQTYWPHLLAIACLMLLAMTMDYHDQATAAKASAADMSAQMSACLRGEWKGTSADGVQIKCYEAEAFDPKTQKSSQGNQS